MNEMLRPTEEFMNIYSSRLKTIRESILKTSFCI